MSNMDDTDLDARERLFPWVKDAKPEGMSTYRLGGADVYANVWHEGDSVRWDVTSSVSDRTLASGSVSVNDEKQEVIERIIAADKARRCAELWISGYRRRESESATPAKRSAEIIWRYREHGFFAEVDEEDEEGWNTWRVARERIPGSALTVDLGTGRQSTYKRAQAAALAFIEGYRAAESQRDQQVESAIPDAPEIPATELRPGDVVCGYYDDPAQEECHMLVIQSDHDGAAVYLRTGSQTSINPDAMCRLIRRREHDTD